MAPGIQMSMLFQKEVFFYIKIFSFIALFVLLIAGINYMNLTTARSSSRLKEIGVRKAIGAFKSNLVRQFLLESLLVTLFPLYCP
jgi:putative ABC transport system permease protein